MTQASRGPVVVDTGVFGARLTPAGQELAFNYRALLEGRGVTAPEPAHPATPTPTPMVRQRRDRRSSTPAQAELFGPQKASHPQAS